MAYLNPDWGRYFLSVEFELDQIFGLDSHALSHCGPHQDRVVPGELVHGLGQLLQPAVVGELAVVDRGIAAEINLDGLAVDDPCRHVVSRNAECACFNAHPLSCVRDLLQRHQRRQVLKDAGDERRDQRRIFS